MAKPKVAIHAIEIAHQLVVIAFKAFDVSKKKMNIDNSNPCNLKLNGFWKVKYNDHNLFNLRKMNR